MNPGQHFHLHSPPHPRLPLQQNRHQQGAYTLIEIMIALFIFSVVSVIVVMSLQNILRVRATLQEKSAALAQLQKAMTIVSRDIEQIIDRPIRNESGRREFAFWGQEDGSQQTLTFTRAGWVNPGDSANRSTLQRVRYRFDKGQLLRATWSSLDRRENEMPSEKPLLSEIESIRWRYIDKENKSYTLWPATGSTSQLPSAVECNIVHPQWGEIRRLLIIPEQDIEL